MSSMSKILSFTACIIFADKKQFYLHKAINWTDDWCYIFDTAEEHGDMSDCVTDDDYLNEKCWIALLGAIKDNELEDYLYDEYKQYKDYIISCVRLLWEF